jgi:ornithine cyclodeaminase
VIWVAEAQVSSVIDLDAACAAVRAALVAQHGGTAQTMEKTSIVWGEGHTLHAIGGRVGDLVGTKTWAHTAGGAAPLLILWDAETGERRAIIEAFALGQLRTAAISAIATDVLADADADTLAVIGSGKQAGAQVEAVRSVRPVREIRVYSPTPQHRNAFAARVGASTAQSVDEAVDGAGIVTTITRARQPFVSAAMLSPTVHINAVGAISPERSELADDVVTGASMVVSDSPQLASDLPANVRSLASVVAHPVARTGRTVFKSMGIGLADVAVGAAVLQRI